MPEDTIHAFRVTIRQRVYRDIEVQSTASLHAFAQAILAAFGFDFDHAYGFFSNTSGNVWRSPVRYELFADLGIRAGAPKSVKRTQVAEAFPKAGSKMTFLFDYGDEWQFRTELIGIGRPQTGAKYPRVAQSVGEAPRQYGDNDE
jgi:hypothetical protein